MSRGFVLAEVAVAYLIITLAIAALVPVFIMAVRANKSTEHTQLAIHLAAELLDEVRIHKWDSTTLGTGYTTVPSSTLGPDAGETASDKTTFDDVDDFAGWSETGVKDPVMRSIAAFSGFSRSVAVSYVDPTTLAASGSSTDYKKVTACAWSAKISPVCLDTVVVNR